MECVSLCSGIGGLELGLSMVSDCHPIAFVEKDQYCRQVLAVRFPGVELHTSIEDFAGRPCDLITAGFPCQPWSCAGKQRGKEDERWIWDHIERIIRDSRPGKVFLENVPGLVSGGGLAAVLWSLASLGFDAVWGVFSCAQLGAPHHRWRIFILAHSDRKRLVPSESARVSKFASASGCNRALADTNGLREAEGVQEGIQWEEVQSVAGRRGAAILANANPAEPGPRLEPGREQEPSTAGCGFWPPGPLGDWSRETVNPAQSRIPGAAHGVSNRLERSNYSARVRAMGNAVSPPVAAVAYRTLSERFCC